MFDLPNAKRVKRSELFSSSTSSDNEASKTVPLPSEISGPKKATATAGNSKDIGKDAMNDQDDDGSDYMTVDYGFDYEFVDKTQSIGPNPDECQPLASEPPRNESGIKNSDEPGPVNEDESEQTYAFNLFAPKHTTSTPTTAKSTTTAPALIKLRSPTPPSSNTPTIPRPLSHYLTSSLAPSTLTALRSQYLASAVSGTTVLSSATTTPWPGTHLPWRVISIPSKKLTLVGAASTPVPVQARPESQSKDRERMTTRSRPRPSKKRRIQLRQRVAAREAAKVAGKVAEEAERDKRTRRNREKKVKRKMREKAKKNAGVDADAGVGPEAGNDGDITGSKGASDSDSAVSEITKGRRRAERGGARNAE